MVEARVRKPAFARPLFICLVGLSAVTGCDGTVFVATECRPGVASCKAQITVTDQLEQPEGECLQVNTEPYDVQPNEHAEFCQLATLQTRLGEGSTVYFSRAESRPADEHRIFVLRRPVGSLPELADGDIDCELALSAGGFQPLFGTANAHKIDFGSGAVEVSHGDQLLFVNHYQNSRDVWVEVGVTLNLTCGAEEPRIFVHQFAFNGPAGFEVPAGQSETKKGDCTFSKPLSVLMIYRQPNHAMERFSVDSLGSGGTGTRVWEVEVQEEWLSRLARPVSMGVGEGFRWECVYANERDTPVRIAAEAPAGCSLFGFYQLRDGGRDTRPEVCNSGP